MLAANYSDRKFESENVQTPGNWIDRNGYIVPDDFRLRDYNLERTRWGLVGNFDWRPDETTKLFVRAFYANYRDSETRDQFRIELTQGGGNQTINQTPTSGTFTTGRGTPLGCPVPTLKIASNGALARAKPGWIDFDAGPILEGEDPETLAARLLELVLETASGRAARNECNDERTLAIWKRGVTL